MKEKAIIRLQKLGIGVSDTHVQLQDLRSGHDSKEDLRAWIKYIRQWKVGGPLPIILWADMDDGFPRVQVNAILETWGVGKGHQDMEIRVSRLTPTKRPDRYSTRWVRAICRELYLHELDEWISIGKKRKYNPHKRRLL
jgi:hypothetical protein